VKCPICFEAEIIVKERKHECPNCGWPYPSKYMEKFKETPEKLDLFYRLFKFFRDQVGLDVPENKFIASLRVVDENLHEFIDAWIFSDDVLAGTVYLVFNIAKDGSVYEFRGVYSNPYAAESACEQIEYENEERHNKAKPHVEARAMNHLYGSSMFEKL
jgi:hypothetical protein